MKVLYPVMVVLTALAVLWASVVYCLVPVGVADGVYGTVMGGKDQLGSEAERRVAVRVSRRQVGLFQDFVADVAIPLVLTNLGWMALCWSQRANARPSG